MANNPKRADNLISLNDRSPEEALEIRRKGQAAQQESFRRRKSLAEALDYLLERNYTNKEGQEASGVEVVAIGLFNKAKSGDTAAIRLLAELVGEAQAQGITITPQVVVKDAATADNVAALMTED